MGNISPFTEHGLEILPLIFSVFCELLPFHIQQNNFIKLFGSIRFNPLPFEIISRITIHLSHVPSLSRENIRSHQNDKYWNNVNPAEIYQRKGDISITLVNSDDRDAFVAQEAARCLECNYVCSKCVDVCPNRANVSIAVPGFQNRFQTLHLDAYCNECGNCAQFCPWNGKPYKDKITVFSLAQDFDNSSNPGFLVEDCRVRVRLNNQSWVLNIDSKGQFNNVPPELNDMCRIISHVHQHHHYLLGRVEV